MQSVMWAIILLVISLTLLLIGVALKVAETAASTKTTKYAAIILLVIGSVGVVATGIIALIHTTGRKSSVGIAAPLIASSPVNNPIPMISSPNIMASPASQVISQNYNVLDPASNIY